MASLRDNFEQTSVVRTEALKEIRTIRGNQTLQGIRVRAWEPDPARDKGQHIGTRPCQGYGSDHRSCPGDKGQHMGPRPCPGIKGQCMGIRPCPGISHEQLLYQVWNQHIHAKGHPFVVALFSLKFKI